MSERSGAPAERPRSASPRREHPSAEIADFIRHCYRRRSAHWPEIYDDMCLVASRREFNGWGYEQLATQGVTFTLGEMSLLSAWVRDVLPARPEPPMDGRLAALPA